MTTVINNPPENSGNAASAGSGVFIGAMLVMLLLVVVVVVSLPYIRRQIDAMTHQGNPTINVQLPTPPASYTPPATK